MKHLSKLLLLVFWVDLSPAAWAQHALPSGNRWLEHLNKDLLPFWTVETAFGKPFGAFPTFRCNDRTLLDEKKPCPEIRGHSGERYLVALSRQAYGYGVAFHVTGNSAYLDAMKAGIEFVRQNAIDRANGGMRTVQNAANGLWDSAPEFRTPQQLAYGLLSMAFYYYLTRDAEVLQDVIAVKNYIFEKYGTTSGLLESEPISKTKDRSAEKKLVLQLDQMNTYLVLLTPMLSGPIQAEWKANLVRLANIIIDQFYSPNDKLFFLSTSGPLPREKMLARTGTDFGHNAKTLWMIRWAGLITGRKDLVAFAEDNAPALFARAYIENCGCWAGGIQPGGALDLDKIWWVYAELDQLAGTLALADPKYTYYLSKTYEYWFNHFVDKEYGEVWETVDGNTHAPIRQRPKQSAWKNAYHTFEHALVGYIVAQGLHAKPVTLYYAFPNDALPKFVQPYFYSGKIAAIELQRDSQERRVQKVTFSDVH
jgi:mannose/cellobiose epimerase-like protein (N-acyl-D-glucosamine 2-epimerase family)